MGNQTFHSFVVGSQQEESKRDPNKPNQYLQGLESDEFAAFATQAEMVEAMASEKYATDAEYREAVMVMVANSDFGGATLNGQEVLTSNEAKAAKRKADWLAQEDAAILKEHVQSLMNDPRYETSTLYRRQVREQILANQELIEKTIPSTKGPTRVSGRIQFSGQDYEEVKAGLAKQAEEQRKKDAREAADAIIRQAEQKYVDVVGTPASDE